MSETARILINVYDGTRKLLPSNLRWTGRVSDGQPLGQRKTKTIHPRVPSALVEVPFFDNLFDSYTVVASPDGCLDTGWMPVRVSPHTLATVDLMTFPKDATPKFPGAAWERPQAARPAVAECIARGCEGDTARAKYGEVLEKRGDALACFLNVMTALADIEFPSGRKPLDFYWNICWPVGSSDDPAWLTQLDAVFKQDRFFCYVDDAVLPEVREAARRGSFEEEKNPSIWGHAGATESYKQTQFDVANVQLTFHGHDVCTLPRPDGTMVKCVKVEPDMDYYKDLAAHALLEAIPNTISGGKTDPKMVYLLRWMAARRVHLPEFDPLYVVQV